MQLGGERYLYTTNYQLQPSSLGPEVKKRRGTKTRKKKKKKKKKYFLPIPDLAP